MPLDDLCRFIRSSRRREAAEDRYAGGRRTTHGGASAQIPAAAREVSTRQSGIASVILVKILMLQMDQMEGW